MGIESQFQHPYRGAKKDVSVENQEMPQYFSVEDAIKMYQEKKSLMTAMLQNINDISDNNDGILRSHDSMVKIHQLCFVDVERSELARHVMHHVISGSTISVETEQSDAVFIYDEKDKKVEKYLKEFGDVSGDAEMKSQKILKKEQALQKDVEAMKTIH